MFTSTAASATTPICCLDDLRAREQPGDRSLHDARPVPGSAYDPASLHRYNYARANPVNFVDPSGRSAAAENASAPFVEFRGRGGWGRGLGL